MSTLKELKAQLASASESYHKIVHTAASAEVKAASDKIKYLRAQISAAITEGADPCPTCKEQPHGMEQPGRRGSVEYEIGCLVCGPFEHTDGTIRQPRVRGGMMPSHAVDAWNGGPDFWNKVST